MSGVPVSSQDTYYPCLRYRSSTLVYLQMNVVPASEGKQLFVQVLP